MGSVAFDLETTGGDFQGRGLGQVRLAGAVIDGKHMIWAGLGELLSYLDSADEIYGHNIFRFDLPVLADELGDPSVYDRLSAKAVDTIILARLLDPPSAKHMPGGYYGLDAVADRAGVPGKVGSLKELAARHGGYGLIPQDDREYLDYLHGDLDATVAVREWADSRIREISARPGWAGLGEYARREMRVARLQSRMTITGWKVHVPELARRADAERERAGQALHWLSDHCGVPLTRRVGRGRGQNRRWSDEPLKSPLSTKAGKEALTEALKAAGATHVPRTATGALALSADALGEGRWILNGRSRPGMLHPKAYGHLPEVRRICEEIARVTGASAKYAEIAKFLVGDRVHAAVGADQASGRWAMVQPSLTNIGKRAGKVTQRAVFLPEQDHVLIAVDLDQVDMRAIAAHCQDPAYMALFAPGRDAHTEVALAVFGDAGMREASKPISHGWNYGRGVSAIAEDTGLPLETVRHFDQQMTERFPRLCEWREDIRHWGETGRLLDNGFGRPMRCDPDRAWTQAPALMGQGTARDILCEGLLRLPEEFLPYLRGVVHDEVILSVPVGHVTEISAEVLKAMQFEWRGVQITAGLSGPGVTWADCYRKD